MADSDTFLDIEETPALTIQYRGVAKSLDTHRCFRHIAVLQEKHSSQPTDAYYDDLCNVVEQWGLPRPTSEGPAIKIANAVINAFEALKKKEEPAAATTDSPSCPASTDSAASA